MKLLLNDIRVNINEVNNDNQTPFYTACQGGHIEIVELLLKDKRVDINSANNQFETPFCSACYCGHIEIIQYILASGREVNLATKNNEGKTAIKIARDKRGTRTKGKRVQIVKLLESFERNPNETRNKLRIQLGIGGIILLFIYLYFFNFHSISLFFFFFEKRLGSCFSICNDGPSFR